MGFILRIVYIMFRLRAFFKLPKRSLYVKWQKTKTYKKKVNLLYKVWFIFALFFLVFPIPHLFVGSFLFLAFMSIAFVEPPDDFD